MNNLAAAELQATVASLGTFDGDKYHIEPDCVECIKDLIRFLRRDDENHEVRRAIGNLGVVKSDLVHIVRDHANNRELFDVTLRLLVNLTSPELLLFKEELPEDKETRTYYLEIQNHREAYKQAFVDKELWTRICKYLGNLLKKDFDERLEDEKLVLERILILIRNILQVPANVREEGRAEGDATLHDQLLWVLHQSGIQDLLLYIASSECETQYCIHVLEIINYMLRDQDATSLATANVQRSVEEKERDDAELIRAQKVEEEKKKIRQRQIQSTRHSRFGGVFVIQNVKGIADKEMVVHKPVANVTTLDFDKAKKGVKKAKNKIAPDSMCQVRRSTLAVRIFLKEFCVEFLMSAYNQLMGYVKDALARHRAQLNDESYYLWAMKFFMEFNRAHQFKVELVTETLSKQTFHFLQQQIENYRDNFDMEKRNRPKYLMWAKRMHLAIRSYEELLLNLVHMEASKDEKVREAGRIIRSGVFYEPEYRELCIQQLSSFNPDRMSTGYLTDLIHTTHVFLKLMEHMSKNRHLLVSKKTKKKAKSGGAKKTKSGAALPPGSNQTKEEQWDAVSPNISALLQGRGTIPLDVVPFDATSDVPIEDQKVSAMKRIQTAMIKQDAGTAVALLRASREVWPEGDAFGPQDSVAEEDFMALREILFADLGVDETTAAAGNEDEENAGEIGEDYEGEDEQEISHEPELISVEQEFDFDAFIARFAVKNVLRPYGILFNNYEKNSKSTNHYIIKMFHRIAKDRQLPGMLFQATIFRVFQRIWADLRLRPDDQNLRELAKFAQFILRKFMHAAAKNKKIFMELLFWKSAKEARIIIDGYETIDMESEKSKKSYWSEADEQKLTEIFMQVKEMEKDNPEADILDRLEEMYSHENKSRRQIGNKLRDLGLINSMREITRKPLTARRMWSEAEIAKITQLYHEFKDSEQPATRIYEQWKMDTNLTKRSKKKLIDKIMELGLCSDRSRLGRVRKKARRAPTDNRQPENSESDSALEDSSSGEEETDSESDIESPAAVKKDLVGAAKSWIETGGGEASNMLNWLAEALKDEAEDREGEDGQGAGDEGVPLVPVQEVQGEAINKESFQNVLDSVGLSKPCAGETYWRIPPEVSYQALQARAKVLEAVVSGADDPLEGVDSDLLVVSRGMQNVLDQAERKKKKKKRGPKKWQPFRREAAPEASSTPKPAEKPPAKPKRASKAASKSVIASDSESDADQPAEKDPSPKSVKKPGKSVQINRDKIRKLLDSDNSDLSSDSEDDNEANDKKNSGGNSSDSSGPDDGPKTKKKSESGNKKAKAKKSLDSSSDEGVEDPNMPTDKPIKNDEKEREDLSVEKTKKIMSAKKARKPPARKPAAKNGKEKETKGASKQKGKNRSMVMADSSDDQIQENDSSESDNESPVKPSKKKSLAADSSESENDSPVKKSANKKKSLAADSSESENDSPVKKSANKKKSLAADSSESENDSPVKKSANKKKSLAADSSDSENESPVKQTKRSVLDSSDEEEIDTSKKPKDVAGANKNSILDSSDEETDNSKSKRIVDSDESDAAETDKKTVPEKPPRNVAPQKSKTGTQSTTRSPSPGGRSRIDQSLMSQSFDSRLDDSRLNDSRLSDSRIDDSRLSSSSRSRSRSVSRSLSRSSRSSRSRSRSPISSPLSSRASSPLSSRPVSSIASPISSRPTSSIAGTPGRTSSGIAATPGRVSQSQKSSRTPLALKNKQAATPASTKRKRSADESAKKSAAKTATAAADGENSPMKPPRSKKRIVVQSDSE